jgi:hypothetical protein
VNILKFDALFFTRLSHLGWAIITSFVQDGFQKCLWMCTKCGEWLPSALPYFRVVTQRWRRIFHSHDNVIRCDVTWVSFVNVETKEHSKQWMHIHQTSQKNLNRYLPARWQFFFWNRKDEIHAAREHNNVRNIL